LLQLSGQSSTYSFTTHSFLLVTLLSFPSLSLLIFFPVPSLETKMSRQKVALKRLMKDHKALLASPLPGANAAPSPDDMLKWHGNIAIQLDVPEKGTVEVPLHFIMSFKPDYPASPPNVGFCTRFPYDMGATYMDKDDLMVICLNILGNFAHVHTEWSEQEGEGWSPGMSVASVLVQLQSVLLDLNASMARNASARLDLYKRVMAFTCTVGDGIVHSGAAPWPAVSTAAEAHADMVAQKANSALDRMLPDPLKRKYDTFCETLTDDQQKSLRLLLAETLATFASPGKHEEVELAKVAAPVINDNIKCYYSGDNYLEATLGYGVSVKGKNMICHAELLSADAFAGGLRQTSKKSLFTHFFPAFINPEHANKNPEWIQCFNTSVHALSSTQAHMNTPKVKAEFSALVVVPKLMNMLLVEMMNGSKVESICFFEAFCSLWRTLVWVVDTDAGGTRIGIGKAAREMVKEFIGSESERHKDVCPDVGQMLALFTATVPAGIAEFVDAYIDESFVRSVMWWQDSVQAQNGQYPQTAVYGKTEVSRNLLAFQTLVLRLVVKGSVAAAAERLDCSCGVDPETLDELFKSWQGRKATLEEGAGGNWKIYFEATGCTEEFKAKLNAKGAQAWVNYLVKSSSEKGPRYQKMARGGGRQSQRGGGPRGGGGRGGGGRGGGGRGGARGGRRRY
jgi:ubiquitin-protein ligase/uncharacterized membrane protein YgcG